MEIKILDMIQQIHTPFLDALMCFVTKLGDVGTVWMVLAVILFLLPKTRRSGVIVMAGFVLDVILCSGILKPVIARVRPCDVNTAVQLLVARPTDYSFPSGHTSTAFAAVAALYFAGEKKLWKPALVLAVLIAFSRMYLYVHYPTDILGGIVVGVACGYAGMWCTEKFCNRKKAAENDTVDNGEVKKCQS